MTGITFFILIVGTISGIEIHAQHTFFIRRFDGKCLEYNKSEEKFIFNSLCRERYRWKGGARIVHVLTEKCIVPQAVNSDSILNLTKSCSGTDTLFIQQQSSNSIKHLISGKCLHSKRNTSSTTGKVALLLLPECSSNSAKLWLMQEVHYVIRHYSYLCWKYSASDDLIKLTKTYVCDRFLQRNTMNLQHYETGKCVIIKSGFLRLTDDCSNLTSLFYIDSNFLLHESTSSKCIGPNGGLTNPAPNTLLVQSECQNKDQMKTYFYDDKSILEVQLVSASNKASVAVNGYEYSKNARGINIVIFDHRSSIFEHKSSYDVYASVIYRNRLVELLGNLPSGKIMFMSVRGHIRIDSYLALALRKHGVTSTFASANLPQTICPMVAIIFTGNNRKTWEESVSKHDCIGNIEIKRTINIFHDPEVVTDCSSELGIRSGKIKDWQLTSTSVWHNYHTHASYHARLYKSGVGWCAANYAPVSHLFQVDLGITKLITGIAIQGQPSGLHAVSKFKIQYSLDRIKWHYYVNSSNITNIFTGVERILAEETSVNWFLRTLARHIRFIPVERDNLHPWTHCVRMELFGCSPRRPIFTNTLYQPDGKYILKVNTGNISFQGTAPWSNKIQIGIFTAETNSTLALAIDQQHFYILNRTLTSNGVLPRNATRVTRIKSNTRRVTIAANINFELNAVEYYNLDISLKCRILDLGKFSGFKSWNVYSYETEEEIVVIASPLQIKRQQKDESLLLYKIKKATNKTKYETDDELSFNISTCHWSGESFANAYQLEFFVYYDKDILTMTSIINIQKTWLSIGPTRNATKPGLIFLKTNVLWLMNNQYIQLKFRFRFPKQNLKRKIIEGAIIIDFAYQNNLKTFNGKAKTNVQNLIPYIFNLLPSQSISSSSSQSYAISRRIRVPGVSILFDYFQNDLYVCTSRSSMSRRKHLSCYYQRNGAAPWHGIPYIASVVGIGQSNTIYGLDPQGNCYVKSINNLRTWTHVSDNEWVLVQNQLIFGQVKSAVNVSSLPPSPHNAWMFASSTNQFWAATNKGILNNDTGSWRYIVQW